MKNTLDHWIQGVFFMGEIFAPYVSISVQKVIKAVFNSSVWYFLW